jgi:hypothetical protein
MTLVFNDELYHQTKIKAGVSAVNYYDGEKIAWRKELKILEPAFIRDSIVNVFNQTLQLHKEPEYLIHLHRESADMKFSMATGVLEYRRSDDPDQRHLIRPSSLSEAEVFKNLDKEQADNLKTYLSQFAHSNTFVPTYKWADADKQGNIYLLYNYYDFKFNDQKKTAAIGQEYSIVKYSTRDELVGVYPIYQDMAHGLLGNGIFQIKDSNTFYFLTSDGGEDIREQVKDDDQPIYNLSEFKLRNNRFVFNKKIKIDLPEPYRKKYLYNDFTLYYASFPIVAQMHDNALYNIETGRQTRLDLGSLVGTAVPESQWSSFTLFRVEYDAKNKNTYVLYMYDNLHYLCLYDPDLNLIRKSVLEDKLKLPEDSYLDLNVRSGLMNIYNNKNEILALPLAVLF